MSDSILIRHFQKTDAPLIYSSWSRGYVFSGPGSETVRNKKWDDRFILFNRYIDQSIAYDQIDIACTKSDPDFIVGYAIFKGDTLEWVYVKELFRKQGIATILVKRRDVHRINPDLLTPVGKFLSHKLNLPKEKNEI